MGIRFISKIGAKVVKSLVNRKTTNNINLNSLFLKKKTGLHFSSENGQIIENSTGNVVGSIRYSIQNNILGAKSLPKSWFDGDELKKFLWLETIIIKDSLRGSGYGTKALRELFFESLKKCAGGRMMCHTAWNSHGFYANNGWSLFGDVKSGISRCEAKIAKATEDLKNTTDKEVIKLLNNRIEYNQSLMLNLKKGKPFQEGNIIFNPNQNSLKELFY